MKRQKIDKYRRKRKGLALRFSEASIQDNKPSASARAIINRDKPKEPYNPDADAVRQKYNGLKTKPFSRNTPLDGVGPVKYGQVSIERQKVELKFREVVIATKAFGHYPEHWHCEWLAGKPGTVQSVRLFFYGDRAVLVKYDKGSFERSPQYPGRDLAKHYYSLYERGRRIGWMPFDVPLDEVTTMLDGSKFGPSTKPVPYKGLHKPYKCKGCDGSDCENCKRLFIERST